MNYFRIMDGYYFVVGFIQIAYSTIKKTQPSSDGITKLYHDTNANFGLMMVLFGGLFLSQNK